MDAQRRPYYALNVANAISDFGNVVALIAIPWFVLTTTGSATLTGLATAVTAIPMIVSGVFGGVYIDRLGFQRMAVVSDVASAMAVALVPLLHLMGMLSFPLLLVLVFLGGLLDGPGQTARRALIPHVAAPAGVRLERANGVQQMIVRSSFMLGAPLAGALIGLIGSVSALWLNAGSFVISALVVSLFVPNERKLSSALESDNVEQAAQSYWQSLKVGFRYIWRTPLMRTSAVFVCITNFLDAMLWMAMPVYALHVYGGAASLGVMMAAAGVGAVISTLAFSVWGHLARRRDTYVWGFVLTSVMKFPFLLTPALPIIAVTNFISGLGAGPLSPIWSTVSQERIPVHLQGRVFSVYTVFAWLAMPIGRLGAGALIDSVGLLWMMGTVAVAYTLVNLSMLLFPELKEMDTNRPELALQPANP